MLLFVIALPGRFGDWCQAITARLLDCAAGPGEMIEADNLAQLSAGLLRTRLMHAIVGSRQPAGPMRGALTEANRRFIVALDDPRSACADLMADGRQDLPGTVRTVGTSCAMVAGFIAAAGALVLSREHAAADPCAAAGAIARHFGLNLAAPDVAAAVHHLAAGGLTTEAGPVEQWWSALPPTARDMATGALAPYLGGGWDETRISWSSDLFFLGEGSSERIGSAIDVTGRARCLLNGPDIALPPGRWSLSLELQVSREAAEHKFFVELVAARQLACVTVSPDREGSTVARLDFVIEDGESHPVALRVSTCRAAFDGAIALAGATVVQLAPSGEPACLPSATDIS
jgi:hypothetical protein